MEVRSELFWTAGVRIWGLTFVDGCVRGSECFYIGFDERKGSMERAVSGFYSSFGRLLRVMDCWREI